MNKIYMILLLFMAVATSLLPSRTSAQCACPDGDPLDSVVHVQALPQTADFLTVISFPRFDPSIGTLNCVRISANITTVASLGIRNLDSSDRIYRFRYTQDVILDGPGGLFSFATVDRIYGPQLLNKYNTGVDSVLWGPDTTFNSQIITDQTSGTAAFLGATGTVNFDFTNTGSTTLLQGSNNYRSTVQTYAVGSFRMAYYWCPSSVLSSGMRNFSVVRDGKNVSLRWTTDNEKLSNRYTIEISRDGRTFTPADSKSAMTIGTARYDYTFAPAPSEKGRIYFRVRQTNAQGKSTYTAVKTIAFTENGSLQASVFPNPVRRQLVLQFDSPQSGSIEIHLVNTLGQVIESQKQQVSKAGSVPVQLARQHGKGAYWLRIRNSSTGEQGVSRIYIE